MAEQHPGIEAQGPSEAPRPRPTLRILGALALVAALALLAWRLYPIAWTGFAGKTLWDWMDLLIVPIVQALDEVEQPPAHEERPDEDAGRPERVWPPPGPPQHPQANRRHNPGAGVKQTVGERIDLRVSDRVCTSE